MTSLLLLWNPVVLLTVARSNISLLDLIHYTQLPLNQNWISPLSWLYHTACYQAQYNPSLDGFFEGDFFPQIPLQLCNFCCLHVVYVAHFLRHTIPFYFFLHLTPFTSKHFILYADNWHTRARLILVIFFPHYFCAQIPSCSWVLNYKPLPLTCSLDHLLVSWGSLVSLQGPVIQQNLPLTNFKSSESWKHLFCYLGLDFITQEWSSKASSRIPRNS